MAQTVFNLALVLILILTLSVADGRQIGIGLGSPDATAVTCNSVYGVESGDTCTSIAQEFNFSFEDFLKINPNINCDSIFVAQWVCINGSA